MSEEDIAEINRTLAISEVASDRYHAAGMKSINGYLRAAHFPSFDGPSSATDLFCHCKAAESDMYLLHHCSRFMSIREVLLLLYVVLRSIGAGTALPDSQGP